MKKDTVICCLCWPRAQKIFQKKIREKIIFGGGVFGPATKFIDSIYKEALKWGQPISMKQVRFEPTQLSGDAGLIGAGYLALKNGNLWYETQSIRLLFSLPRNVAFRHGDGDTWVNIAFGSWEI